MLRLSTIMLGAIMLLPYNAYAGNLQFGKAKVTATTGLDTRYDSNIYLVPAPLSGTQVGGGEVDAMIVDARAGLGVNMPLNDMHKLTGGFGANWQGYNKMQGANNAFNLNGEVGYGFTSGNGITANIYNGYLNTEDPAFSEQVQRSRRWNNRMGAGIGYQPNGGKLSFGFGIDHARDKYLAFALQPLLNRYSLGWNAKVGYQLMPKTKAYVRYSNTVIHYTDRSLKNSRNNDITVGLEGKMLNKLAGTLEAGITSRKYDEGSGDFVTLVAGGDNEFFSQKGNANALLVKAGLKYMPTERCSASLDASRSISESTFGNSRFYRANMLALGFDHKFGNKLSANTGVSVGIDNYGDSNTVQPSGTVSGGQRAQRRDDTYGFKLGAGYAIMPDVSAKLGYQYDQRFSVFSGQFNYRRTILSLGVSATF